MTEKLQTAVVGYGAMGRTHADAWRRIEDAELVGVVSRSAQSDDLPIYADVDALVSAARPDIVSVCTPTDTHPKLVTELLQAGCDVVVEKPIALEPSIARELYATAEREGRALFVAHVLRFFPEYAMVADAVTAGKVGKVATIRLRRAVASPTNAWFQETSRSGGLQFDLMIHDVDFAISILGTPRSVYAHTHTKRDVSVVQAVLTFEDGAIAQIEGVWGDVDGLETRCEVSGSLGNVFSSTESNSGIRVTRNGMSSLESPLVKDPYTEQLRAIVRARAAGPVRVDEQAILAVEVCAAMTRSIELGRAVSVAGEEE